MEPDPLDQFADALLTEKGITGLDENTRLGVIAEIKSALVEQINRAILMQLPEEKLDELNEKMDSGHFSNTDMQNFVVNCGVNINQITAETMLKFKAFYLGQG